MERNTVTLTPRVRAVSTFALTFLFVLIFLHPLTGQQQKREIFGAEASAILPGAELINLEEATSFPRFVRFARGQEIPVGEFFNWLSTSNRSSVQPAFRFQKSETDQLQIEHQQFVQLHQGVPVDQTHLILHIRQGKVYAFNGVIKDVGTTNVNAKLTESQALHAALKFVGADKYKWEDPAWEQELKERKSDLRASHYPHGHLVIHARRDGKTAPRLAYVFDISALSPDKEIRVCVDASNGTILYDVPMESNCSATTVNTIFNGSRGISTELHTDEDFRLRDDCTAAVIHVRDWNSATLTPNPIEIENTSNTWTTMDEIFGGTTLWTTKQAYNYFLTTFGRNSYDNANGDVSALINALFDCSPPAGCITANNASMSFSGGNMKVGLHNNGVLNNSYATLDIIGHEYAHAVTGSTAMLVYEEEWGALNESFSDIFGEASEIFTLGTNDWLMGGERSGGALRSLWDPNAGNQPDTYLDDDWTDIVPPCDGSNDECGVHDNSGVQNRWFYLISAGGNGTNDNGDVYDVDAIGVADAQQIAYRNLVMYLGPNSDYADARTGSIQAAVDLFGACSDEVEAVMDAWYAVGIGVPFLNVTATVTSDYNGADVSCFGASDGQATATATDGTGPYVFTWSNGQVGSVATGLPAGTHTVTVTDANGCTETAQVTLSNPPELGAKAEINSDYNGWPVSCFGACDGIVEAVPVGGTSPYTYAWSASAGSATTKIVSGLCAGLHIVTVTDVNGCSTIADVTLSEPPPLEIEAGPNQTIFFWDINMACTSLEATAAAGGVPPYTYEWSSGGNSTSEDVCLEVWEDTISIVTYYVTITDANGCQAVDSLDICYVDINCGGKGPTKVSICHYPPDNPANYHTLCVSLRALGEHLSHGDHVGECDFVSPCGAPAPFALNPLHAALLASGPDRTTFIEAFPNPFSGETNVRFVLDDDGEADMKLYDMNGRLIRTLYHGFVTKGEVKDVSVSQGELSSGIYMIYLYDSGTNQTVTKPVIIE